jgi:hypothetical protein
MIVHGVGRIHLELKSQSSTGSDIVAEPDGSADNDFLHDDILPEGRDSRPGR